MFFFIYSCSSPRTLAHELNEIILCIYHLNDREEMACDEAELEPDEFAEKMHSQQQLHEKVRRKLFPHTY